MKNEYAVVSLLSGVGGLDYGFKLEGFDVKVAVEIDQTLCKAYKKNFEDAVVFERDIATVTADEIKEITGDKKIILVGSIPFPYDKNRYLTSEFLRIAKVLKPEFVVGEMVSRTDSPSYIQFKKELENITGLSFTENFSEYQSEIFIDDRWKPITSRRLFLIGGKTPISYEVSNDNEPLFPEDFHLGLRNHQRRAKSFATPIPISRAIAKGISDQMLQPLG